MPVPYPTIKATVIGIGHFQIEYNKGDNQTRENYDLKRFQTFYMVVKIGNRNAEKRHVFDV